MADDLPRRHEPEPEWTSEERGVGEEAGEGGFEEVFDPAVGWDVGLFAGSEGECGVGV